MKFFTVGAVGNVEAEVGKAKKIFSGTYMVMMGFPTGWQHLVCKPTVGFPTGSQFRIVGFPTGSQFRMWVSFRQTSKNVFFTCLLFT